MAFTQILLRYVIIIVQFYYCCQSLTVPALYIKLYHRNGFLGKKFIAYIVFGTICLLGTYWRSWSVAPTDKFMIMENYLFRESIYHNWFIMLSLS